MNYPPSARKSETWLAQEEFARIVRSVGYEAKTCFGWQHGVEIIEEYLKNQQKYNFLNATVIGDGKEIIERYLLS